MTRLHDIRHRTCRHWRGAMQPKCGAGLEPKKLAGEPVLGWALRVPCAGRHRPQYGPCKECPKYRTWTDAEIEAQDERRSTRTDYLST